MMKKFKELSKEKKITLVISILIILALIVGIVFATKGRKKDQKPTESIRGEQLESATNELPKDYKGEVDIVEQEIKEEVIDEKTGEKKTVTKKVIKQVPKGTKVQGGKVIGTTTTTKINQTKPNTTAPKTTKPNTTTPKPNKPNTTKPKTTVPTTKHRYPARTWTYSATKAYIKSKGGQWDDSLTLNYTTWITSDETTQSEINETVDYLLSGAEGNITKIKFVVVDESNWKKYDKNFNGYNPITNIDRERFQDESIEGYWLIITLYA